MRRSRISFFLIMISLIFFLIPLFLQSKLEKVPISPYLPEVTELTERSFISIFFYITIPIIIVSLFTIMSYYIWYEKPQRYGNKNSGHLVIKCGIGILALTFVPVFYFAEFPSKIQDILSMFLWIISAILLFVGGAIYKETPTSEKENIELN